jgi:hypothetical protein
MAERIRALEDAAVEGGADGAAQPLFVNGEDFAFGADDAGGAVDGGAQKGNAKADGGADIIDAFGTLTISDHGISRFFGLTGGSEVCARSLLSIALVGRIQCAYMHQNGVYTRLFGCMHPRSGVYVLLWRIILLSGCTYRAYIHLWAHFWHTPSLWAPTLFLAHIPTFLCAPCSSWAHAIRAHRAGSVALELIRP